MRVWITRAQPAAEATADRIRALGHEAVVAPLLAVRPLDGVRLDLTGVGAIAFTSANAVPCVAALTPDRGLKVFAVGEATARAARTAGFADVTASDADVQALVHRITEGGAPDGIVLHPGAEEPAGDLAAALKAAGLAARNLPVYRTEAAAALPAGIASPPDAVLVHSPKAGRTLAGLLPPAWPEAMEAFGLSPACVAPLMGLGFRRLEAARFPNEAALLSLLPS